MNRIIHIELSITAVMAICVCVLLMAAVCVIAYFVKRKRKKKREAERKECYLEETSRYFHEMKTHLTAISGFAEIVEKQIVTDEEGIRRINGNILRNTKDLLILMDEAAEYFKK